MRTRKIISAVTALTLTATAMLGTGAFSVSAADGSTLTFDIQSGKKNEIHISAEDIAKGDCTVPVDIFIPENPGVNAIQLKLQINDGQVQEDGSFKNYGLYFADAAMASPFCFDSASEGNAAKSLTANFSADAMNVGWIYSQDQNVNADAAAQAETTEWSSTDAFAYKNAFATANLVVPKDTAAGTYTLDIRKETYSNKLTSGVLGKSTCTSADSESALSYASVPLKIVVDEEPASADAWKDDYKIADGGFYYIMGDVCAEPGATVSVPVYIYGDTGTAGAQLYFDYPEALKMTEFAFEEENYAYFMPPQLTTNVSNPATYAFGGATNMVAQHGDGSILTNLVFEVPAEATEGTTYDINFFNGMIGDEPYKLLTIDRDGKNLEPKFYSGSITVVTDKKTALNKTAISASEIGSTENLTLFNATGDVTWKSSDESVATVDQNGFVKITGSGSATITATNNGTDYTCSVSAGVLFGDVDKNGKIEATDAQLALIHYTAVNVAGQEGSLTEEQQKIADVSGDGNLGADDPQFILIYFVQKEVSHMENVSWKEITGNQNAPF